MNELIKVEIQNQNGKLFVSSRDIAKGLEKEHSDVTRKMREVLDVREFSEIDFTDEKGRTYKEYLLNKNSFVLLVMNYTGYNDFKRAYIRRFDEMEQELSLRAPKTYAEALRVLANEVEEKELMTKQRDEAIATKAWISDKKTATAMNTASQKVKEVNRLKNQLDKSKEFASVKAVGKATHQKFSWRDIRDYCNSNELDMRNTYDANYGSVKTYPAEAWWNVYGVNLKKLF